jgi:hypothetical protein
MCEHLRSKGCPWTSEACVGAADYDHVNTLRWLRESGCPCYLDAVCIAAAQAGSLNVLAYLLDAGALQTSAALLTEMLSAAGATDELAAAQWLRQQGAEWPATLGTVEIADGWFGATLARARAEGCTAPLPAQQVQ